MVSHRCHKCTWFDNTHHSLLVGVSANFGYCRKHKPVIFQAKDRYYGAWPLVDRDDLCGEFRQDEELENGLSK